jgi:hypothetical protein
MSADFSPAARTLLEAIEQQDGNWRINPERMAIFREEMRKALEGVEATVILEVAGALVYLRESFGCPESVCSDVLGELEGLIEPKHVQAIERAANEAADKRLAAGRKLGGTVSNAQPEQLPPESKEKIPFTVPRSIKG